MTTYSFKDWERTNRYVRHLENLWSELTYVITDSDYQRLEDRDITAGIIALSEQLDREIAQFREIEREIRADLTAQAKSD